MVWGDAQREARAMEMDPETIAAARKYHARRDAERREERERLRTATYDRVSEAVRRAAPRFPGVRAVYLFGSLVQPGRFRPRSDIDVAVDAVDVEAESRFWRALEAELGTYVDVRPYAGGVAYAVDTYGDCMNEKHLVLERSIQRDLDAIDRIYSRIGEFLDFLRGLRSAGV
jgi:predicted nucleotidyltransferase